VNTLNPSLHSAMDRRLDRSGRMTGMSGARAGSVRRTTRLAIVIAVQVILVLSVVMSMLGLGYENGTGVGPGFFPRPSPAGASRVELPPL
jgi:hypothetical protein